MSAASETIGDQPVPKGKRKLVMAIVCIVCIGAGAALPMVLDVGKLFGKSKDDGKEKSHGPANTAIVPFSDVVVNLAEERMNRYLRLKIAVLVAHEEEKEITELIAKKKVAMKSVIISHLAGKTLKDVSGSVGVNRLQREILEKLDDVLFPEGHSKLRGVVFEEYVVQ